MVGVDYHHLALAEVVQTRLEGALGGAAISASDRALSCNPS